MRKLLSIGAVIATAAALVAPVLQATPAAAAGTNTTVVLSFDDGVASQSLAVTSLKAHNMHGVFYVNTDFIGTDSSFLNWAQLTQMQSDGNEIGGHGLDHTNLSSPPLPVDQVTTQVCNDRQNLINHGINATDFAYPYGYGYESALVRQVVQQCGYSTARRAWGLYSSDPACFTNGVPTGCGYPYAETIPPTDPYGVLAGDNPQTTTTLAQIETLVTQAETHGGGLVPIVFHEICNGCDQYSVTQANFDAFLTWLQARAASGTVVKTMREISDTTPPTTTIKCNNATCSTVGYTSAVSVSLAATDAGGSTVASIRYTTDGTDPTSTHGTVYSAPFNVAATATVKYRAYDTVNNEEAIKSQLVTVDSTAPTASITCDAVPCSANWYSGDVQVGLSATDAGVGVKEIRYTTDGSTPTAASTLYSTPFTVASNQTVKYRAYDNLNNASAVGSQLVQIDRIAPATTISCDGGTCSGGWGHSPVSISLAATDDGGSGLAGVHFTTDGSTPTLSSPTYTLPFTVDSVETVNYRAWDAAGNIEGVQSKTVQVDKTAPTASIQCNNAACSSDFIRGSVKVALSASDNGGSGVDGIHYTTDGSAPTAASPLYSAPFTLSASATVRYLAIDNAGNAGAVGSQAVRIDRTGPTVSFSTPHTANAKVSGSVRVTVKASDAGSKVARVLFYVDGHLFATDTSPSFSFVWNSRQASKGHHKLTAKAVDHVGNSTSRSITVRVH
jgi:peptidoglycan/xylan/chitin deacetylase (PgdA/CDA1 family)